MMNQCQKKNKRSLANAKDKSSKIQIMYWKKQTFIEVRWSNTKTKRTFTEHLDFQI